MNQVDNTKINTLLTVLLYTFKRKPIHSETEIIQLHLFTLKNV